MSRENYVELGWAARPLKEQHPDLSDKVCADFDRDNLDLCRLIMRGVLTRSQAEQARKRLTKSIMEAIKSALAALEGESHE